MRARRDSIHLWVIYTMLAMDAAVVVIWTMMLLAVGAASPSPRIGMPDCVTSCGGVDVPFPFGIGPNPACYLQQPGFNLTCDRTRDPPRLLIFSGSLRMWVKHILDGSLSMVEVVRTVDISSTGSDDHILRQPFRLAVYNELVLTGCNVRSTLQRRRNKKGNATVTVSGCFSFCEDDNGSGYGLDRLRPRFSQGCSGAGGCCRAPILVDNHGDDETAAAYSVDLDWFGGNSSADRARAPARAFVAKEGWFDYWISNHSNAQDAPTLDAPVYLRYDELVAGTSGCSSGSTNLCRSDHSDCIDLTGGYKCGCKYGYRGNAYVPGGCQADDECEYIKCYGECIMIEGTAVCKCPPGYHGNAAMPGGCVLNSTVTVAGECTRQCGDVEVPFPFGIQDMGPAGECYHPGFNLTCDRTHAPPRLLIGDDGQLRVEKIHLDNATVRVLYPGALLNNTGENGLRLLFRANGFPSPREAPYSLAPSNELVLTGCGALAAMLGHRSGDGRDLLSGCVSFCKHDFDFDEDPEPEYHYGGGKAVQRLAKRERRSPSDKYCDGMGCCQTHISEDSMGGMPKQLSVDWLESTAVSSSSTDSENPARPPAMVFVAVEGWFDDLGFSGVLGPDKQPPARAVQEVPIILQWEVLSDKPNCTTSGNICKSKNSYCKQGDRGYTCQCHDGYHGNPYLADDAQGCRAPDAGRHKYMIIGVSVGAGLASAAGLIISFFIGQSISKKVKHRKAQMLKQKFFDQNRGQLLQQLVSHRADISERMIISLEELEKATNNFDKARELGGGGHGTVYKGILSDLHVVAIKKPKKVLQREIDDFINEVAILSQINHRNVVKLYGCCLETEVPMLVYEFISNGTLYDHLHVNEPRSLSWEDRLRIAAETAKSLAYLHSTASVPIIHRDVKSANILLDDTLTSKVADFGASRYISVDKSGLTTKVQGTVGYLDPMYFYTGRLTDKSDVYSYGVMLIELLTRKKPFSYLSGEGEGLVAHFVALFEEGNLSDLLDPQITDEGGKEVDETAALAVACINLRGEYRPSMRQVELTLEGLRPSKEHIFKDVVGEEELGNNNIMKNSPLTVDGRSTEGSTRQYNMEVELTMSSRYPR